MSRVNAESPIAGLSRQATLLNTNLYPVPVLVSPAVLEYPDIRFTHTSLTRRVSQEEC